MLKDIYSPLEIDEQWDQRAPMSEGDALEGNDMFHAAPDSNTAVMEAPAPIAAGTEIHPDSSAVPVTAEAPAGAAADPMTTDELGAQPTIQESEEGSENTMNAATTAPEEAKATSDDEAIAKMNTPETDTTEVPEEGGVVPAVEPDAEAPADTEAADEPSAFIPTTTISPDPGKERDQSAIIEKDASANADEADQAASADSGIVMANHHDSEHKTEDVTPEMATAPPIAPESESSTTPEDEQDAMKQADEKITEAIEILKADHAEVSAGIAEDEHTESEARASKEAKMEMLDTINARLVKLSGIQGDQQTT